MQKSTSPFSGFKAVTPNDNADLPSGGTRGIYIGGAGNIAATDADGNDITLVGLVVGTVYQFQLRRIKATSTTATNIVALY